MTDGAATPRTYDNRGRTDQAHSNRRKVAAAAHRLFLSQGYAATTIAAIAREAGVSAEMIYKSFGNKSAVAKTAYDVALAGDDEPIPMVQRPEFLAVLNASSAEAKLRAHAALARGISGRIGPLCAALLAASHSGVDAGIADFAPTVAGERLVGATLFVEHLVETNCLRSGLDHDKARDTIWTLNSPEVYQLLVTERGWSLDAYEQWLAESLIAALAPHDNPS
ncbi:MAG: TetR/AcrR family transcriptional regulator [Gordonia amarae]